MGTIGVKARRKGNLHSAHALAKLYASYFTGADPYQTMGEPVNKKLLLL